MKTLSLLFLVLAASVIVSCKNNNTDNTEDIIIENDQFKLIISKDGYSKSLVQKSAREECLMTGKKIPVMYNNTGTSLSE